MFGVIGERKTDGLGGVGTVNPDVVAAGDGEEEEKRRWGFWI